MKERVNKKLLSDMETSAKKLGLVPKVKRITKGKLTGLKIDY